MVQPYLDTTIINWHVRFYNLETILAAFSFLYQHSEGHWKNTEPQCTET